MGRQSFLKGAAILGIAGIIVKIMGAFFRIPLGNMIGDEGMGYYQASYPIYVLLLVISTAGIPTAISKLVAERNAAGDRYGAHRIFKVSFILLFIIGIVTSSIMFFGSKVIVKLIKNTGAYYSMVAIAPALLFVPIMAAYRGYFQGLQDMVPTAISQIIEQFGRTAIGLILALLLLNKGKEIAAAGASFGAAAGAVTGAFIIIWIYRRRQKQIYLEIQSSPAYKQESASNIIYKIFAIAIPITIGAAILPIMNMIDVAIVMRRLQAIGFSAEEANGLYGQLTGMAAPLINLPQILTVSLGMSLVPAISDANQRRNGSFVRSTIQAGIKVTVLIGLPAALGLVTLAKPIMLLLFPLQKQSAIGAASSLAILGIGVIFLSLVQTFTAILQGMGKQVIPVMNLFIGSLFKIVATFTLTGIYVINVKGAAIGTVLAYGVAALLNFFAVKRLTNTKFPLGDFIIKPVISVAAMSISVLFTYGRLECMFGNTIAVLGAIAVGGIIYGLMLLTTGSIKKADFEMLPKGQQLVNILSRIGLLRK